MRKLLRVIRGSAKEYIDVAAGLVTIFGIIFAIWQYYQQKDDNRINATLSYVARFGQDPVAAAAERLDNAWRTDGYALLTNPGTEAEWETDQIDFIKNHNLQKDVDLVASFFDELYICIDRKICDQKLALVLLGDSIENSFTTSKFYLRIQTKRLGGQVGCGLTALYPPAHALLNQRRPKADQSPRPLQSHACAVE